MALENANQRLSNLHGMDPNESLTVKQVMQVLKISRSTFYDLHKKDPSFMTFRVGRARRMRARTLLDWVEKREKRGW